jgi:hypothetical protein
MSPTTLIPKFAFPTVLLALLVAGGCARLQSDFVLRAVGSEPEEQSDLWIWGQQYSYTSQANHRVRITVDVHKDGRLQPGSPSRSIPMASGPTWLRPRLGRDGEVLVVAVETPSGLLEVTRQSLEDHGSPIMGGPEVVALRRGEEIPLLRIAANRGGRGADLRSGELLSAFVARHDLALVVKAELQR